MADIGSTIDMRETYRAGSAPATEERHGREPDRHAWFLRRLRLWLFDRRKEARPEMIAELERHDRGE